MSQEKISFRQEAERELDQLSSDIQAKRRHLEEHGVLDDSLEREWDEVTRAHDEMRTRLQAHQSEPDIDARDVLRGEIASLKHLADRWVSKVDGQFGGSRRG